MFGVWLSLAPISAFAGGRALPPLTHMANKKDYSGLYSPFRTTMIGGTDAGSIILSLLPYEKHPSVCGAINTAIFFLNHLLFVLFTVATIIRYVRHPDIWSIMIRHPVHSLFVGTFPMGAITLIGVATTVFTWTVPFWRPSTRLHALAGGLWWIDAAISMLWLCCWGLIHVMQALAFHFLILPKPSFYLPLTLGSQNTNILTSR
ncbi:voltage-dependent anion channel-domain-containing protein [Russula brevipes]|nr:voltage-dependent anion channel-domain-containing protein [Russula brevipes]